MALFTLKYAPQNTSQIVGQDKAVAELKDFILNYKKKKHKAVLLHGPPGNGKTCSVYALAKELNYDLLEFNSSEMRNEEAMTSFLGAALGQQSLFFRPKIILIDEIDNISGREDRGCIPALLKMMEKSTFPLVLTANTIYDDKLKNLVKKCQQISFVPISLPDMTRAIGVICEQENIQAEEKVLTSLARQSDGDFRAALLDLQVCSIDNAVQYEQILSLSNRNRAESILKALVQIFKSSSVENALPALENVDLDLEESIVWIDENLPREYLDPKALAKAYEHLARADVFQGRIRRRQQWRFLAYMNDLMTAGISSSKDEKNTAFVPYQRTQRFLQMWFAKQRLGKKKEIAVKWAKVTRTSQRTALQQMPYLQIFFRKGNGDEIARELKLEEEEVEWLRG